MTPIVQAWNRERLLIGESWEMRQSSADAIRFPHTFDPAAWRLRADAATHSNVVEKSLGDRWHAMASFLVDEGACKQ